MKEQTTWIKVLKTFSGERGMIKKDTIYAEDSKRAEHLVEAGLAEIYKGPIKEVPKPVLVPIHKLDQYVKEAKGA